MAHDLNTDLHSCLVAVNLPLRSLGSGCLSLVGCPGAHFSDVPLNPVALFLQNPMICLYLCAAVSLQLLIINIKHTLQKNTGIQSERL